MASLQAARPTLLDVQSESAGIEFVGTPTGFMPRGAPCRQRVKPNTRATPRSPRRSITCSRAGQPSPASRRRPHLLNEQRGGTSAARSGFGKKVVALRRLRTRSCARRDIYTLIQTAKLNDVDPQAWLADILSKIVETPQSRPSELLPWNWTDGRLSRAARLIAALGGGYWLPTTCS
jgi:IS66 C-terminal element